MTTVTFRMEGDRITGFDSQGHSGYAESGSDIVCAAITSAIRLVEATVNDVLGLAASVKIREEIGNHLPAAARGPGPHSREHLSGADDGTDGLFCPAP